MAAVWLDNANTYGSIPQQLTFYFPKCYVINPTWIDLLTSYYNGLWSKSFLFKATSGWHKHFGGIFTGFTVSVSLYLLFWSLLSQFSSPVVKAIIDDLFVMSPSLSKTLHWASLALSWAKISVKASKSKSFVIVSGKKMSVKASKSKSFVIVSGKIMYGKSCITLGRNNQATPSIANNPMRFLQRAISNVLWNKYQADSLVLALVKD